MVVVDVRVEHGYEQDVVWHRSGDTAQARDVQRHIHYAKRPMKKLRTPSFFELSIILDYDCFQLDG